MKIEWIEDVRNEALATREKILAGELQPRFAHAANGCLSRVMYTINTQIRYAKARNETPDIPFMHRPATPKTAKTAKRKA